MQTLLEEEHKNTFMAATNWIDSFHKLCQRPLTDGGGGIILLKRK
jgi:hypothetical protein